MEFLHPILTEVLSRLRPTQFTQVIQWVERMSFILVNTPSAVEDEERHIFRNYVHTIPHAMSKKQTVIGFIFSIPLSLDPPIAKAYGLFLMNSTRNCWKKGATAPLMMHVFVRLEDKFRAILLLGNTSRNRGVSSSASASGMLCCTSMVATLTSACVV